MTRSNKMMQLSGGVCIYMDAKGCNCSPIAFDMGPL
jgi:hypothetical protein